MFVLQETGRIVRIDCAWIRIVCFQDQSKPSEGCLWGGQVSFVERTSSFLLPRDGNQKVPERGDTNLFAREQGVTWTDVSLSCAQAQCSYHLQV